MSHRNPGKDRPNPQASRQSTRGARARSAQAWDHGSAEQDYWRTQYQNEPYYHRGTSYDRYDAAYRTGAEAQRQFAGQRFVDVEGDVRARYEANRGAHSLEWGAGGRDACRAAWEHAERRRAAGDRDIQSGNAPGSRSHH